MKKTPRPFCKDCPLIRSGPPWKVFLLINSKSTDQTPVESPHLFDYSVSHRVSSLYSEWIW
jgi:hypothetical protein